MYAAGTELHSSPAIIRDSTRKHENSDIIVNRESGLAFHEKGATTILRRAPRRGVSVAGQIVTGTSVTETIGRRQICRRNFPNEARRVR